jgi:hypothetical protein
LWNMPRTSRNLLHLFQGSIYLILLVVSGPIGRWFREELSLRILTRGWWSLILNIRLLIRGLNPRLLGTCTIMWFLMGASTVAPILPRILGVSTQPPFKWDITDTYTIFYSTLLRLHTRPKSSLHGHRVGHIGP